MQSGGIISTYRVFVNIVFQVGVIQLLKGFVPVERAVYIDVIILFNDTGEPLAELHRHILPEGAPG